MKPSARRDTAQSALRGILPLDKPAGWTSHDVVAHVRRQLGVRRAGHAGTLDPMATGLLLVCVGQATRVAEYLMRGDKVYQAQIRLGITTDTDDATGPVIAQQAVNVDEETVRAALAGFVGTIQQVPPRYSAIKQNGRPLYKLARAGIDPPRKPRQVTIHRIDSLTWNPPDLTIEVACSSGTYIRALARDLGEHLNCGGHLSGLIRLASGHFTLKHARSLDELEAASAEGRAAELLLPMDEALRDMERLTVDAEAERRIRHGQQIDAPSAADTDPTSPRRVYSAMGELLAILTYDQNTGHWQPHKVFATGRTRSHTDCHAGD
ncbi:MAG: tRNA pseudouridine(55) synthase TruB [Chloroflexota bacterium]|nr:tRNA pseudouridine(55) synthase TruB [Chloroflexota bacterium]